MPGVLLSATGLVAVTYGVIDAGEHGWTEGRAPLIIAMGVLVLAVLVWWQRRAAAPLIDLALFRDRSFAGGTLLATIAGFAFFGLLFALPQLFQAVGGADAFGAGLRLLPVIGGLMAGARIGERLAARTGPRVVIAAGLTLMAAALFTGAATDAAAGYGVVAAWISVAGVGLGLTMPTSMNVAISALGAERSGVGNALIQAVRQVGSAIGVAVLGTALNAGYRSALPATAGAEFRDSAATGTTAAQRLGDDGLLEAVRAAFVHGMDLSLILSGGVAAAGVVLALVILPRGARAGREPDVLAESGS